MLVASSAEIWVGALFTLAVFTYLYKENPLWRIAEHIYVGMTAAYSVGYNFHNYMKPTIITDILEKGYWSYVIPILIGLAIYTRYVPSINWVSRYPLSLWVGYGAGMVLAYEVAPLMSQIAGTFKPFNSIDNIIYWIATVCTLIYFFFTIKRTNPVIKYGAAIGRWSIMAALGVSFGNTALFRFSLLLDRMKFLLGDWLEIIA